MEKINMYYILIKDNEIMSIMDVKPNMDVIPEEVEVLTYDGDIPLMHLIYIDGSFKDAREYHLLNGKYYSPDSKEYQDHKKSIDARHFLNETDWQVLRHRDQKDLGLETSLTEQEYKELLQKRQEARSLIIMD